MSEFALYPVEQRWWSFNDYRGLMNLTRRFAPKTVLEFGPGSSTLALIEGDAGRIDSMEDNPVWLERHRGLEKYPGVRLVPYTWSDPLVLPPTRYDMAFIDGPLRTENRVAVLEACLDRCDVTICPAEERMDRAYLVPHVERLAKKYGRTLEWVETGPLCYAMGVIQ